LKTSAPQAVERGEEENRKGVIKKKENKFADDYPITWMG
jgi:hypothetical protein